MFAGIGGFRAGLDRTGGFQCVGHCEIDKYADASYRAIHDMFPAFYRMTTGKPLRPSSPRWMTWGIMSSGLCLTQNILESPSQGSGCSLSAILIPDAPEKYFLSSAMVEKLLYNSSEGRKATVSTTQEE